MSKTKDAGPAPEITEPPTNNDKPRRGPDPELQAIARIDRILADFTDEDVMRMLTYLHGKRRGKILYGRTATDVEAMLNADPAK